MARILSVLVLVLSLQSLVVQAADPLDPEIARTEAQLAEMKRIKAIRLGTCTAVWEEQEHSYNDEFEGRSSRVTYKVLACVVVPSKTRCDIDQKPYINYEIYESQRRYSKEDIGTKCSCDCKPDPYAKYKIPSHAR